MSVFTLTHFLIAYFTAFLIRYFHISKTRGDRKKNGLQIQNQLEKYTNTRKVLVYFSNYFVTFSIHKKLSFYVLYMFQATVGT